MNTIKKESGSECLNEKKSYEPPRAMRLGEMKSGAGDCESGSGDSVCFESGNSASSGCYASGNNGPI
jgi:hypothetical protein